jgi:outer membrane receptor for ferrienterochelin and colicins
MYRSNPAHWTKLGRKTRPFVRWPYHMTSNLLSRFGMQRRQGNPLASDMLLQIAMPKFARTRFVFIAFLLATMPARAQVPPASDISPAPEELTLKDLGAIRVDTVNGASKFVQQVTEAPSSVTIITADQIRKYGYRTLADALNSAPGLYVSNDRSYSYLGIRGFNRSGNYNSRMLVLIDGHRMNDNIYDAAFIETAFPVDVDLIQRIEIIRGPGSALYGSNAFFGIVNVITRRGGDLNGPEVSASAGSLGTYRSRISYGKQFNSGLEGLISWSGYRSDGYRRIYFPEFDSPATNNGIAQDADADQFSSSLLNVSYGGLSIRTAYVWREKHAPTAAFNTVFNDPRTRAVDSRGYLEVQFQRTLSSQWHLDTKAFYDQSGYNGTYVYDLGTADSPLLTLNHDSSRGQWLGFEFAASRRFLDKHRLSLGTEGRFNVKQLQQTYYDDPAAFTFYDRRSSIVPSAYALDEFRIRRNVLLSAGLRYDHYYTFGGTLNPRFGLIYSPQQNMAIKLLYGQAFRAPNVYELYYSDGTSVQANPSLQPETIRTTELAFEKYFSNHVFIRASAFLNQLRNLVTESNASQNLIRYVTRSNVDGKGLEFELSDKHPSGWEGRLSYTASDSLDARSRQPLSNSPRHVGKAGFTIPLARRMLFAAAEAQYVSRRLSVFGVDVPDHFVTNLSLLTSDISGGFSIAANVYNVFDKQYGDPGGLEHVQSAIPQDGRVFRLKLEYRPGAKK